MRQRRCFDCGRSDGRLTALGRGHLCLGCRRRRHYHHQPCPACAQVRPLAYLHDADEVVCAGCAGMPSVFACHECGREDNPYGARRCARCILRERLTTLLTDPHTGQIHVQLRPVFDELVGCDRPQAAIWWLRRPPGVGPRLLADMAAGQIEISHDTFRHLPSDKAHDYLRGLLAAVGVLPPFDIRVERMPPWLDTVLADLPDDHAALIRRFARWHVLPRMRTAADRGHLTQTMANAARRRIRVAIDFLTFLAAHNATAASATQDLLERYQLSVAANPRNALHTFLVWLRDSGINSALHIPWVPQPPPAVTVSQEQRWQAVSQLLHDPELRLYTRVGGLFLLLFAQPLTRIVAMRTDQVTLASHTVHVAFHDVPIQMPTPLDDLIREHLSRRGKSLYASRDTGWLFPGGNPGMHLATENLRSQLVAIGIKPYEARKASLFQLAGDVPAPVLAELIGITDNNAANWAKLAARDWTGYIAQRAR